MVAEATTKPTRHHNSSSSGEEKHHKQLDREVRNMVSSITGGVSQLHGHGHDDGDDDGVRIITLAGTNTGATMKSELDHHEKSPNQHGHDDDQHHHGFGDREALRTYVNSNFQAINNSIMMGGSYTTNDPGVHMDIEDSDHHHHGHMDPDKLAKKEKKVMKKDKDKENSKTE